MPNMKVVNMAGKEVGEITLSDKVIGFFFLSLLTSQNLYFILSPPNLFSLSLTDIKDHDFFKQKQRGLICF